MDQVRGQLILDLSLRFFAPGLEDWVTLDQGMKVPKSLSIDTTKQM